MEFTRLGNTGLKVSRLALGCMSYGDPTTRTPIVGADRGQAQPFFQQAVELGVTFWDTANVYQLGTSEEVVGRAITRYSRREDIVLATKVSAGCRRPGWRRPLAQGDPRAGRRLAGRLGTDYIDLYQIHRFDPETPVEETMETLHDLIKAGKVRYIGASSMYAWQFAKLQHAADLGGWTRFVSMQNQYNLLRRQDERELMAMCGTWASGWSRTPRRKGRLARPVGEQSPRSSTDHVVQAFDTPTTSPSSTPSSRSPRPAVYAWPRSRWPGCCATRSSRPRLSARRNRTTSPRQWLHSGSGSPMKRCRDSGSAVPEYGPSWY